MESTHPQAAIIEAELIATRIALADTRTQLVQTWRDRDADMVDAGTYAAGLTVGVFAVFTLASQLLVGVGVGFVAGGSAVGFLAALWSRHRMAARRDRRRLQL